MKRFKKAIRRLERQCNKLAELPCLPPNMRLVVEGDKVAFEDDDVQWNKARKALRVRCPQFIHGLGLVAAIDTGGRDDIADAMEILEAPVLNDADFQRATEAIGSFFMRAIEHQDRWMQLILPDDLDGSIH